MQYRNNFLKVIDVGFQGQFRAAGNETTTDGVGGSLQVTFLPGMKVGGTYTRTNWGTTSSSRSAGWAATPIIWPLAPESIGGYYNWELFTLTSTTAIWRLSGPGLARPHHARSILCPRRRTVQPGWSGNLGLIGGFTYQDPKVRDPLLSPRFKTRYFILGAEWFFAKNGKVYTEGKIDNDSVTATGEKGYSVFTSASVMTFLAGQSSAVNFS